MEPNTPVNPQTPGIPPEDQQPITGPVVSPGSVNNVPVTPSGPASLQPSAPQNVPNLGQPSMYSANTLQPAPGGSGKKIIRIVIIVLVVAVLGVGGYFGYKALKSALQKGKVGDAVSQSAAKAKASGATDIGSLNGVTLTAPASALASLTESSSSNPNAKIYTTADQSCLLIYGTGTTQFIPGSDVTAVVNQYLDTIRKSGATIQGPEAADPRILPAATGSKKYSIPSLTFSFTLPNSAKKGKGYFSASVLKNSDRAIVETACFVDNGDVPQSQMDAMEAIAKQITVAEQ